MHVIKEKIKPCITCPARVNGFCRVLMTDSDLMEWSDPGFSKNRFVRAKAREKIYIKGDLIQDLLVLCQGWAIGFRQLSDGRRQNVCIILPGDVLNMNIMFTDKLSYCIEALTDLFFNRFSRDYVKHRVIETTSNFDLYGKLCMEEERRSDEILIGLGRRSAEERIAHFILSLVARLGTRQMIVGESYPFPLRQHDIADMMGLTPVHVSRVINSFRRAGLIELSMGRLRIVNLSGLRRVAYEE